MTIGEVFVRIHDAMSNLVLGRRLVERTAENKRRSHERLSALEERTEAICQRTRKTATEMGLVAPASEGWEASARAVEDAQREALARGEIADVTLPLAAEGEPPPPETQEQAEARRKRWAEPEETP